MEQATPSTQVNCQWCTKPMDSAAVNCPSCGKLRKDIYNDKVKCYVLCALGGLLIGIGISQMKGHRQNNFYDYYNQGSSSGNSTGTILLVIGIVAALAGIFFWVKVSQQLKTYWWK